MLAELYTKDGKRHLTYDKRGVSHLSNMVEFDRKLVEGETVIVCGPYAVEEKFTVFATDETKAILVSQQR